MEDNPFMNSLLQQKGFPRMHDTALTPVQTNACTQQPSPSSPSLAQQIVAFLEWALWQSQQECAAVVPAGKRPRGAPPKLPMQQLWLAVLVGTIRHATHLSTIWRNLCLEGDDGDGCCVQAF